VVVTADFRQPSAEFSEHIEEPCLIAVIGGAIRKPASVHHCGPRIHGAFTSSSLI
jgi:hypothetical protein